MLIKLALFSLLAILARPSQQQQQNFPVSPEHTLNALYEQLNSKAQVFADVQPSKKFSNLAEAIAASEKLFEAVKQQQTLPSLTVGLSVRNKTVFSKAWGLADLENEIPAQVNTTYRIASISKSFASLVLGTFVDQGLAKYSDPLSKYLKPADYPAKSFAGHHVEITLGQLLSHTAGEPVTALPDISTLIYPEVQNITASIRPLNRAPLTFAPGTNFNYSNYGYQLIGAVIEQVAKKPYPQLLAEFFARHGMKGSAIDTGRALVHHIARYYRPESETKKNHNVPTALIDGLLMANGWWAAGGVLSTVPDLLRYGNLLLDVTKGRPGSVITNATLNQIWTSRTDGLHLETFPPGFGYGYGWVVVDLGKLPPSTNSTPPAVAALKAYRHKHFRWHNGGLMGTSTYLAVYPEEEAVVVALTNRGEAQPALMQATMQTMENVYELVK